ncbi:MAG: helix-turn-helix domain-containing protein [Clostridia bacterium]|nr:helix-turn-helix domain-containing protein [Clostridia bacterium]
MLKLIIIEDETTVLGVLNTLIGKADNRFEICGLFSCAEDAVDYISTNPVDAVISDICLSGMSGLDFFKLCHEKYPDIVLAAISAYSKFEYAQDAIKYGVADYMLKPITMSKTKELLAAVYDKLTKLSPTSSFCDMENNAERIQIISEMLSRTDNSFEDFFEKLAKTDVVTTPDICKCAVLSVTIPDSGAFFNLHEKYNQAQIFNIVEKLTYVNDDSFFSILYNYQLNAFKILIFAKKFFSTDEFRSVLNSFIEMAAKNFVEYLNLTVDFKIENISSDIYDFHLYMQNGLTPYTCATLVIHSIYSSDRNTALSYLNVFTDFFKSNSSYLNTFYKYINSAIEQILGIDEDTSKLETDVIYDKIIARIKYILPEHMKSNNVIDAAIEYIEKNLSSNISLESTAAHCFLSPAYFSMCFKNKTGKTFSSYLSDARLNKAKSLLSTTDIPINRVAELCGFNSASYFHRFFKRLTGTTPLNFKNNSDEQKAPKGEH